MRYWMLVPFLGALLHAQSNPPQEPPKPADKPPAAAEPAKPDPNLLVDPGQLKPFQLDANQLGWTKTGLYNWVPPKGELRRKPDMVFISQQRICAIPLTNVLGDSKTSFSIRKVPIPDQRFPMREVQVPAPSCDDLKK